MRHTVPALLLTLFVAPAAVAGQGAGGSRGNACSFLTRDIVTKVATADGKRVMDVLKPREEPVGPKGSSCGWADIELQVDPFAQPAAIRSKPPKDFQPVAGVGDTAFFRNNSDRYAELMVWTGAHHFTIQMGVPMGVKAESIKSNTISLANSIIPKLK